jgi:hypothetical protein
MATLTKEPKKANHSKWVAVTADKNQTVIAEDKDPEVVKKKADKTGKEYYLMFKPDPNHRYIF